MKRACFLILLVSSLSFAQRLPAGVAAPERYSLSFAPDFTNDTFAGAETISVRVLKPTTTITLNADELDIHQVTIEAAGSSQAARVTPLPGKEMVELSVPNPLPEGAATVRIRYTGKLNDQLRGLYLSRSKGRKYAITQFEATDARRAFPAFDEPAYKAVFDVTVVAGKRDTALSNGTIVSDTPGVPPDLENALGWTPGSHPDRHTIRFSPSPKMSSYLVALAVGDWECVRQDADSIPIRVCSVPGSAPNMGFALESAVAIMKFFNRYFSVQYPYAKLDVLGAPDFSAGAMENTGLIIARDVLIVSDPATASTGQRKGIASVMAHEMAHQWFGDLVTMQWWDDIWLNEGFATWMANKPLAAWKPEWHVDLDEVQESAGAINTDSAATTRPIHAERAETPAQIDELFDGIAYGKAAAVLRMTEAYLGRDTFRAGVNAYLRRHQYGNATSADFWNALAAVSGRPVDRLMPGFVNQPGVPVVSLQTSCAAGRNRYTLAQRRYFNDRALFQKPSPELWRIPVCLKTKGAGGRVAQSCDLLAAKQATRSVPGGGCAAWTFGNAAGVGYYRTAQPRDAVLKIAADAQKDLTPGERIVLLNDEWALVRVALHHAGDYLDLASHLADDRTLQVQQRIVGRLANIHEDLLTPETRPRFEAWIRRAYRPLLASLGWQAAASEPSDTRELRSLVVLLLGRYGRDPQVLAQARSLAEQYMRDPSSVAPDLVSTVLTLAAFNGDAELYDRYLAKAGETREGKSPETYYRYFYNLAAFSDPALLNRTLQYALTPEVRFQDTAQLIASVMGNPAGRQLAWDFIRNNWQSVQQRTPPFGGQGIYVSVSGSFCDAAHRAEVRQFWTEHPVRNAERSLQQALYEIDTCTDLRAQQAPHLATWLQRSAPAAP